MLLTLLLACGPQPVCNAVPVGDCADVQHCTFDGSEYWQVGEAEGKGCADAACELAFEEVIAECDDAWADADCRTFEIGDCTETLSCCNDEGCFYLNADLFYECDEFDCADAQTELGEACGVEEEEEED